MADELPPTPSEPGNSKPLQPPPLPPPLPAEAAAIPSFMPTSIPAEAPTVAASMSGTVPTPSAAPGGVTQQARRRERRWVISSFIGAMLSTVAFVVLAAGVANVMKEVVAGNSPFQNPNPQFMVPFVIVPATIMVALAMAGTAFGWVGLAIVRRSKGQKRGLFAGLVGALMWPLLLLSIGGIFVPTVLIAQAAMMRGEYFGPERVLVALGVALVLSLLVAWLVARWGANPKGTRAVLAPGERPSVRHKPFLMAFTSVAYVTVCLMAGMAVVKVQVEARQAMEAERFAQQAQPMPLPTEVEPPQNAPVQQVRRMPAIAGQLIEPGRSAKAECNLLGTSRALAEMRVTFWSNAVPVNLPSMTVRAEFPLTEDTSTPAVWRLDTAADGSQLTLAGPTVSTDVHGVQSQTVTLSVPPEVRWMAMPAGTLMRATPSKTARQWLYISASDAAMGQRLNAEWAISVDVALVPNDPAVPAPMSPLPK